MFCGMDMCSGKFAMLPQYINIGVTKNIQISDGTYDHLYLSANPDKSVDDINEKWDKDSKLNADFQDSLDGGNSGFSLKNTDTIIIKRREKGTMDWITIFVIPVNEISDFNFVKEYYYGQADTDYDFMIISSIGGVQNAFEFSYCKSQFEGLCLADKEHFFRTIFNVEPIDISQNISDTPIVLLNSKYPVTISNDDSNYSTGTITASYFQSDENCNLITGKPNTMYREDIMTWLTNKKVKIVKLYDGTIKMIKVTGTPTITDGGHPNLKKISFEFVEVGNVKSEEDLYATNLSDVLPNRW